jgi:hypothetical protein
MPNPNDPKDAPRRDDETRRPEHRTDQSRKGHGPDNPLPGEPGGPSTSGYSESDRKAAEEGQRRERDKGPPPADRDPKR